MSVSRCIPALTLVALFCGVTAASAQSATPVEAVRSNGSVAPALVLTPAQRSAIYNSVRQQRVHTATAGIAASIGAPVASSLGLRGLPSGLPDLPALADGEGDVLKYATVEGDVVIVDPISMRVVEVIHAGAGP